jgi:hypothetical protein
MAASTAAGAVWHDFKASTVKTVAALRRIGVCRQAIAAAPSVLHYPCEPVTSSVMLSGKLPGMLWRVAIAVVGTGQLLAQPANVTQALRGAVTSVAQTM